MHLTTSYRRPAWIRWILPVFLCSVMLLAGVMPAQAGAPAAPAAQTATCTPGEAVRPLTLANSLSDCDDCRELFHPLNFTINYFGTNYSNVHVTSNGHLIFNLLWNIDYTPYSFETTNNRIIAPFFADVDLRSGGTVFFGQTTINVRPAFAVTYDQVGYYEEHTDKVNTFQVLIIDRSDVAVGDFDLEFNYDQIEWETGDASGGTNGLGGTSAVAGYSAGDGVNYFQFPGSLVNYGLLDDNTETGLVNSATGNSTCGRHVFAVRGGVASPQEPPQASADNYTTDKGVALTVSAPGVLSNDTDPQDDTLSAVLVSGPSNGRLTLNSDGSFEYTPNAGFSGTDSFTYQASDGYFTSEAVVTITVVNHAPEIVEGDSADVSMSEDGDPTAFSLTLNATDQDGDTLTWSVISGPAHGSTAAGGTGASFDPAYTPDANFNGSDSFVVQVSDGDDGGLDSITVNVTVAAVNDPPVIDQGDTAQVTMSEDSDPTAFVLALSATDVENDALSWSLLSGPSNGSAVADGTGDSLNPTYTPNANFNGSDSFVVQVSDGNGGLDSITVNVTVEAVNDAPTFVQTSPVAVEMDEDGAPQSFSLTLDASDIDGDVLTWGVATAASYGIAEVSGTGDSQAVAYTPQPHYNGADSFQVRVEDPSGAYALLTVDVQINPQPDDPVIMQGTEITVYMDEDGSPTPFNLTLAGMDPDGDDLTWSLLSGPAHGSATAAGSGPVLTPSYMPEADFNGQDSFVVELADVTGRTSEITVTVEVEPVNDVPVIDQGDEAQVTMSEDGDPTPFDLSLSAQDVDGDDLTWSLAVDPVHGSAAAAGSGPTLAPTYTPDADFYGSDSFVVQVADGSGGTASLTVTVTIEPVNDAPRISEGDSLTVVMSEDGDPTPFALDLHAVDPEGNPITWLLAQAPAHGTALADGSGESLAVDYTPTPDFNGTDIFTVQVSDDSGATNQIVVEVQVQPVNDAPQVQAGSDQQTTEGQPVSFSGSYQDPDGAADVVQIDWDFGDGSTTSGTLTPQHSYQDNGSYTVRMTVTDSGNVSVRDELVVTVQNAAPELVALADRQANVDQPLALEVAFTDPGSADSHTASVDWGDGASSAATVDAQQRTLQASHTYLAEGTYIVVITLQDDDGGVTTGQFQVQVTFTPVEPTTYRIIIPVILTSP